MTLTSWATTPAVTTKPYGEGARIRVTIGSTRSVEAACTALASV